MRHFELIDGSSSKFWEIALKDSTLTVRFGRIGTDGQTTAKVLASPEAARVQHDKLVAEKTKKGYRETGASSPADAPASPLETDIVPALLELGRAMIERPSSNAAVWTGKLVFPRGGVEAWRKLEIPGIEGTVGTLLDRVRDAAERGEAWLDVHVTGDVVEIQSWEWRGGHVLQDHFELALTVAGPLRPTGSVTCFEQLRGGTASRVVRKFSGKALELEEDGDDAPERYWQQDKGVKAALAAIAPGLAAWIGKHPTTRARIEHSGKSGYIDRDGREIIAPRFSSADDFSEGLAIVYDGWKAHFIDVDGTLMPGFFQLAGAFARGLAPVAIGDSEHWGYVDGAGQVKVEPTFSKTLSFRAPLAMVLPVRFGEARWIDREGELVGDPFGWYPYEPKCHFADGRVWTAREGLAGFACLDEQARPAIERRFYNVMTFSEGLAAVVEHGATAWGYVDRDGKGVIEARFDEAHPFAEGRAVVRMGDEHRLIDRTGAFVGAPFASNGFCTKQLAGGMLPFAGKGGIGFLDAEGNVAIAPRFEQAYGFFEDRAYVLVKGKRKGASGESRWGHIDRAGEYVVAPTLEWTNRYQGGLAPVKVDGLYGFIDTAGKIAVPARYAKAQTLFADGRAWVTLP